MRRNREEGEIDHGDKKGIQVGLAETVTESLSCEIDARQKREVGL